MHIHIHIHIHIHTYTYTYTYTHTHKIRIHTYAYTYIYIHAGGRFVAGLAQGVVMASPPDTVSFRLFISHVVYIVYCCYLQVFASLQAYAILIYRKSLILCCVLFSHVCCMYCFLTSRYRKSLIFCVSCSVFLKGFLLLDLCNTLGWPCRFPCMTFLFLHVSVFSADFHVWLSCSYMFLSFLPISMYDFPVLTCFCLFCRFPCMTFLFLHVSVFSYMHVYVFIIDNIFCFLEKFCFSQSMRVYIHTHDAHIPISIYIYTPTHAGDGRFKAVHTCTHTHTHTWYTHA
jgi:hypothetical protein